jgi:hypothetical protein
MSESVGAAAGPAASSSWTEFEPPTRIRWTELSKNRVVASQGGCDLAPAGDGTQLTVVNVLEGRGVETGRVGGLCFAAWAGADRLWSVSCRAALRRARARASRLR